MAFTLLGHLSVYYCLLSDVSSTRDYVMLCTVSLQSQQVAFPQAHGPGAVPDCPFVTGQHQIFDLQLPILEKLYKNDLITQAFIIALVVLRKWCGSQCAFWQFTLANQRSTQLVLCSLTEDLISKVAESIHISLPSNIICSSNLFPWLLTARMSKQTIPFFYQQMEPALCLN